MSLALWERGTALADICQAHLDGARERIEAARPGLDGLRDSRTDRRASVPARVPSPPTSPNRITTATVLFLDQDQGPRFIRVSGRPPSSPLTASAT